MLKPMVPGMRGGRPDADTGRGSLLVVPRSSTAPNWSGTKLSIGRGYLGPTVNLVSTGRPVALTEEDRGWTAEPHKLKPGQFGKLELERRLIYRDHVPPEAVAAFMGSKSAFKRDGWAYVYAVTAVFVSKNFQGEGYGLAMYLKALELASIKGYWLMNDVKRSTSPSATATWKAVFRYAAKTVEGPPPPERLFDYAKQKEMLGYRANALGRYPTVVPTHRPVMAAFGLNERGVRALQG